MRVGLVLGAGGVVGASWLIGSLEALADETGWDPGAAKHIVGTSAGAVVGALTAGGFEARLMAAFVSGERLPELEQIDSAAAAAPERSTGTEYHFALRPPWIGPGSWRLAMSTLRHPLQHSPGAVLTGWLPRGFVRTDPIQRLVERFVIEDWPSHPNYWAVACDYHTGRRVAFGRHDAPVARIGEAVAASCAIPAFYQPVTIGARRYVDGGVCSPSNLDLLCGYQLDLVICLNPISTHAPVDRPGAAHRFASAVRAACGRRLAHEARKLRSEGADVVLLQPTAEDLDVMGINLMARDRRVDVIERARLTMCQQIRMLRQHGQPCRERSMGAAHAAPARRPRAAPAATRPPEPAAFSH